MLPIVIFVLAFLHHRLHSFVKFLKVCRIVSRNGQCSIFSKIMDISVWCLSFNNGFWNINIPRFIMSFYFKCLKSSTRGCIVALHWLLYLKGFIVMLLAFFSIAFFLLSPQMVCIMSFQMFPQIACLRWCIITLVAFVWLFPTVYF